MSSTDSALSWQRSRHCASSGCVEVAIKDGSIYLRDSKHVDSPVLQYDAEEWRAFVAGVKDGQFDLSPA